MSLFREGIGEVLLAASQTIVATNQKAQELQLQREQLDLQAKQQADTLNLQKQATAAQADKLRFEQEKFALEREKTIAETQNLQARTADTQMGLTPEEVALRRRNVESQILERGVKAGGGIGKSSIDAARSNLQAKALRQFVQSKPELAQLNLPSFMDRDMVYKRLREVEDTYSNFVSKPENSFFLAKADESKVEPGQRDSFRVFRQNFESINRELQGLRSLAGSQEFFDIAARRWDPEQIAGEISTVAQISIEEARVAVNAAPPSMPISARLQQAMPDLDTRILQSNWATRDYGSAADFVISHVATDIEKMKALRDAALESLGETEAAKFFEKLKAANARRQ